MDILIVFLAPLTIAAMLLLSSKNGKLVNFPFKGKTYRVPPQYRELADSALQGNRDAKYEIILQGFSTEDPHIPRLYFETLCELSEKDLGVLVQLADSYLEGIGTPKDETKGREIYARALELYDNPPENMYIPEESQKYRNMLLKGSGLREVKK